MSPYRLVLAVGALLGAACSTPTVGPDGGAPTPLGQPPTPPQSVAAVPPLEPSTPATVRRPMAAGEHVSFEAGVLRVGSRPGLIHRRPSVEADLTPVELPAFDIDRLPYPNDPERPIRLAATRREAARLCEERDRRLCGELQWERACRGGGESTFATGEHLDLEACVADPGACGSSDGVLDLGIRVGEWTASDAGPRLAVLERTAVARGGHADSTEPSHRCGARHAVDPSGGGRALGFRCCGGASDDVAYPDVGLRTQFRDLELSPERWREILATVEQTRRFATDFEVATESAGVRALARGNASVEEMHWELTRAPFAWSPSPGEEVWIVSGSTAEASVLIALYPLPEERFVHAASFVVREPESSFAVLRDRATRRELLWSTCWGCAGESGAVRFEDDATIVIVQQ